jgi:prevent-host-death family protein
VKDKKACRYPAKHAKPDGLSEAALDYGAPVEVSVRSAKDGLSKLLEMVAHGHEVVITSDGEPRAKLIPYRMKTKKFKVDWELLKSIPAKPGPSSDELIRGERDSRP